MKNNNDATNIIELVRTNAQGTALDLGGRQGARPGLFEYARGMTNGIALKRVPQSILDAIAAIGIEMARAVNDPVQKFGPKLGNAVGNPVATVLPMRKDVRYAKKPVPGASGPAI